MSSAKLIQNPEVPGLECYLPPPPPPPPLPPPPPPPSPPPFLMNELSNNNVRLTTTTHQHHSATTSNNLSAEMTPVPTDEIPPALGAFPNISHMPQNPYMMHAPPIQPQTPGQTPWWIPTDADTTDFYNNQWYDSTYKNVVTMPPVAPSAVTSVTKNKSKSNYKRKSEFIDPTQDAEKVANAQRQLSALMKPLKCDLCNAVMNSPLQAKLHYEGKPHQKKVSMFLNQSVKKLKSDDGVSGTTNNDWQLYCDICKTWFTSQTDATQHYAGKKHIRAANGGPRISRPSKKALSQYNQADPTGRFGIGIAFQGDAQPTQPVTAAAPPEEASNGAVSVSNPAVYVAPPYPTPFRCDLCGVSATRQDQLETHKRGARHMRMLRLNGLPVPEAKAELSRQIDYSIYRTPSGQYYCAPCNLSVTSEITFAQHIESKKHRTHTNLKLPNSSYPTAVAPNKPESKKK